jgi:hypothetical protein
MPLETVLVVLYKVTLNRSMPVAARSEAWACGRSLAGMPGSNSTGSYECLSLVSVVCCQVEVSAADRSLGQSSPTECVLLSVIKGNNNLYTHSE